MSQELIDKRASSQERDAIKKAEQVARILARLDRRLADKRHDDAGDMSINMQNSKGENVGHATISRQGAPNQKVSVSRWGVSDQLAGEYQIAKIEGVKSDFSDKPNRQVVNLVAESESSQDDTVGRITASSSMEMTLKEAVPPASQFDFGRPAEMAGDRWDQHVVTWKDDGTTEAAEIRGPQEMSGVEVDNAAARTLLAYKAAIDAIPSKQE